MNESKVILAQSAKFQPEMVNKGNIPAVSQYSVQFYTRKYYNDFLKFRLPLDNHKSSKCGKKCQNYENIQDSKVSAAHRKTGQEW